MTYFVFIFPSASPNIVTVKGALEAIFQSHEKPLVIYSDGGATFKAASKWLNQEGVKHIFAPAYHPQSVGLGENVVKMVVHRLRCFWMENLEEVIAQWDFY